MKTNLKLLLELGTTANIPSVPTPSAQPRRAQGGAEVILRGQYAARADGRSEVLVSMDASAVARKLAIREMVNSPISTTGKDTGFGTL